MSSRYCGRYADNFILHIHLESVGIYEAAARELETGGVFSSAEWSSHSRALHSIGNYILIMFQLAMERLPADRCHAARGAIRKIAV